MVGRLKGTKSNFSIRSASMMSIPDDHRVREIAAVLDLSWVRGPRGAQFEFHAGSDRAEPPQAGQARRPAAAGYPMRGVIVRSCRSCVDGVSTVASCHRF